MELPVAESVFDTAFEVEPRIIAEGGAGVSEGGGVSDVDEVVEGAACPDLEMVFTGKPVPSSKTQERISPIGLDVAYAQFQTIASSAGKKHCLIAPVRVLPLDRDARVELEPPIGEWRGSEVAVETVADTAVEIEEREVCAVTFGTKGWEREQEEKCGQKQSFHGTI